MIITQAKYVADDNDNNFCIIAVIDEKQMAVPLDSANRHYIAIQEWVAEGNTIEDAE